MRHAQLKEDKVKIRAFLPVFVLSVVFMLFLAAPAFAQEDVTPKQEEEVVPEEEVIEEEVIEEEVIEEEIIDSEEVPAEEEVIEEEIVPEEEVIEKEIIEEEVIEEEIIDSEEVPAEEEIVEEPAEFKPGWTAKVYVNGGPIEPWGSPGTGSMFDMGMRAQFGAQLNIGNWVTLPTVLHPLTAEVMVGYGMWNIKEGSSGNYLDAKTNVISVLVLGRYDVTDLILNLIGFEYPALGIFGVAGFQYNMQSWDFPNWTREFDMTSSFGLNLGVGVKYNLMVVVGKPVEIDLRFTQGVFIMGDVKDQDGEPFFADDDYKHTENGLLLGIAYPF